MGFSSGLEYTPGAFASSDELIELCSVMDPLSGIYATHMRNEDSYILEALDEAIAVARGANVTLHIAHLKCLGERNWGKLDEVFERISEARRRGVSITFDRYPYTAYNTSLSSLLPVWAREGDIKKIAERLNHSQHRTKIRSESLQKVEMIGSWNAVLISSVELEKNRALLGKTVSEIVGTSGTDPFDFVCDLIIEESNGVGMCGFGMSENNTARILSHPLCMVASDASARAPYGPLSLSNPHPRTYGTFPRVLAKYVRGDGVISLPEAVRKMTFFPATRLGLKKRGRIAPEYFADLVIFDSANVRDTATYSSPHSYPEGMAYVLVNGRVVVDGGEHTGELAGRILGA
jgi:N-acyl-D-amino-acid deacylase